MPNENIFEEEIETKKLKIRFLPEEPKDTGRYGIKHVRLIITLKNPDDSLDLEEISKDLKDLGNWREYKELKKKLEE